MPSPTVLLTILCLILLASCAASEEEPVWKVTQIRDHIYELTTDGGGYAVKVIASVGDDGLLIVDAGQKRTAEDLKTALQTLGYGLPAIIINTHSHIEHTAGNMVFGKAPVIIGHENLRTRLTSGGFLFDEFPEEALPEITFADSLNLFFNGELVRLVAFPGAHDDSDIIVWFTGSKIVCVGALVNGRHFPSVDEKTGDVLKYPEITGRVISLLPEDVTIVPGHGEDCTLADARVFHDMLVKTTEIVRVGLAQGKDAATLQKEDVLADWADFEISYVDRATWIEYLATGLAGEGSPRDTRETLHEPMYYAIKQQGVDAAIKQYHELKASRRDDYKFDEDTLVGIAYKLYTNDKYPEAVKFFELCAGEYPAGKYTALCFNFTGNAYSKMNNRELAIKSYRRALEIAPGDEYATKKLEELDAEKK